MKQLFETPLDYLAQDGNSSYLQIAQALATVAIHVSTSEDLSSVLDTICEQAAIVLNAPAVIIRLYNPQNETLEVAGSFGISQNHIENNFAIPREPLYSLTDPNGEHVIFADLDQSPPTPVDQLPIRNQLSRSVVANMIRKGEFVGVLVILLLKDRAPLRKEEIFFIKTLAEQASISVERFRLTQFQERKIQEMEEFVRISNDLRNVQTKAEMVNALLWGVQRLFQADRGVAFLFTGNEVHIENSFGYEEDLDFQSTFEECPLLATLRSNQTIFIEDIQKQSHLLSQNCFQKPLKGAYSAILIPLCYPQEFIGLVLLAYSKPQKFNDAILSNFHLFQELVDSAMGRLQFMENLEQLVLDRTRDLKVLYDITTILNTPISFSEALIQVLNRTISISDARAVAVHTLTNPKDEFKLLCQIGFSTAMEQILKSYEPFQLILNKVIQDDAPCYFENLNAIYPELTSLHRDQEISYLGIPIRARGKHQGVLSIIGMSQPFSMNDQILLVAIADHLGLAIERNRLAIHAEEAAKLEERQRLARELHDALAQSLYSMTLLSKAYQSALPYSDKEEIQNWLKEFNAISQDAMKELRLLLYELRPTALGQDGLDGAIKRRIETVEKRAGIETHLELHGCYRLSAEEEETIYRIVQEALNNALQHAHHHRIDIFYKSTQNQLILKIQDDGVGFDLDKVAKYSNGMGINNMKARANQIGAHFNIYSKVGDGTTIVLTRENHHE
ncbi:MAG: GAF domain-containing protein [Anaerolineales bacterium]